MTKNTKPIQPWAQSEITRIKWMIQDLQNLGGLLMFEKEPNTVLAELVQKHLEKAQKEIKIVLSGGTNTSIKHDNKSKDIKTLKDSSYMPDSSVGNKNTNIWSMLGKSHANEYFLVELDGKAAHIPETPSALRSRAILNLTKHNKLSPAIMPKNLNDTESWVGGFISRLNAIRRFNT